MYTLNYRDLTVAMVFFVFLQVGERLFIGAPGRWYGQGKILLSFTMILNNCFECDTLLDLCIITRNASDSEVTFV